MESHTPYTQLYRSKDDRILAGVLGGLGNYFHIDPVLLRIVFVIILFVTAVIPCVLLYAFSAFIIPLEKGPHVYEHTVHSDKK